MTAGVNLRSPGVSLLSGHGETAFLVQSCMRRSPGKSSNQTLLLLWSTFSKQDLSLLIRNRPQAYLTTSSDSEPRRPMLALRFVVVCTAEPGI